MILKIRMNNQNIKCKKKIKLKNKLKKFQKNNLQKNNPHQK